MLDILFLLKFIVSSLTILSTHNFVSILITKPYFFDPIKTYLNVCISIKIAHLSLQIIDNNTDDISIAYAKGTLIGSTITIIFLPIFSILHVRSDANKLSNMVLIIIYIIMLYKFILT